MDKISLLELLACLALNVTAIQDMFRVHIWAQVPALQLAKQRCEVFPLL